MTFLVSVSCQILNEDSSEYSDQILCVGAVLPKGCVAALVHGYIPLGLVFKFHLTARKQ